MRTKKYLFLISVTLIALAACQSQQHQSTKAIPGRKWWKEAIVYQIYPRSFKDSNGDGIGDLQGIISKLDYIKSLGINTVWLNPIYASPNADNGYDISNYREIMKEFGTMADFDTLLNGLHRRGIKLVMDLVVNHTSDEHRWFRESRSSRDNPYRDYYHWWNAERGKPTPRYSMFDENNNAWRYDSTTNAYYLHYFSRKQPDLNWENPKVRQEVYKIMEFWLKKGIDGFRMDAFQYVAKDTTWPKFPKGYEKNIIKYYGMGPHIHDYLKEMYREVLAKYDILTVSEGAGSTFADAHALVDSDRHELDMAYHFEGMDIGNDLNGYSLLDFKKVYTKWDSAFSKKGWLSIFLANHDVPRMVSKFGNDSPEFRRVSSEMLSTFIMTMRGTPYYYNGDEIGMTNISFDSISDYRDIAALNGYKHMMETHGDSAAYMARLKFLSRDNARTPFQWDTTANAGFTTGTPWIKVNPNYKTVNVAVEEKEPNSCLNYFRKVVQLRKDNLTLVYGKYTLLDKKNPKVYSYLREEQGKRMLILLNFTSEVASTHTDLKTRNAKLLLSNYPDSPLKNEGNGQFELQPYEAAIYQLE